MWQKNAWNTHPGWERVVAGFNKMSELQSLKIVNIIENCSAHYIDYTQFNNLVNVMLPPNMKSIMQPVYCSIDRSFKCAFRRLLISHILSYVQKELEKPEPTRSPFKIATVVTTYDAFLLVRQAWDLVPKSAVLKSWLKNGLLAPNQHEDVLRLFESCGDIIEPSMKLQNGSVTSTEMATSLARANAAHIRGTHWIEELNTDVPFNEHPPFIVRGEDEWQQDLTADIVTDGCSLQSIEEIGDIDESFLNKLDEA